MRRNRIGQTETFITELGFGGSAIGNLYEPIGNPTVAEILADAWELGIRYFDTAPHYGAGLSERRTGIHLRERNRSDFTLSTKVGRLLRPRRESSRAGSEFFVEEDPFVRRYDYSYDGVMRSVEDSLQRLGTNRIDILLIHDIGRYTHGEEQEERFRTAMEGGYRAMHELREDGLVGALGMGVNEWEVCFDSFRYADFDCFMLASRYTLLEQAPLDRFLPECQKRGVSVIGAGVYNSGILAQGPVEGATYEYADPPAQVVEKVERIYRICEEFAVRPAACALQFPLRHPAVAGVVVGMRNVEQVRQNMENLEVEIPVDLWERLAGEGLVRRDALFL